MQKKRTDQYLCKAIAPPSYKLKNMNWNASSFDVILTISIFYFVNSIFFP